MKDLKYPIGTFGALDPRWNLSAEENICYMAHYPHLISAAISGLTEEQMETPYRPGGWTVTQLIHHIADSHMNAYIRFKLSLTEIDPIIKPYEEAQWAKLPDSNLKLINTTLVLLKALHTKWATLMESMKDSHWAKRYHHPASSSYVDLGTARKMYHWHSAHHLAHITRLIERENW
jgi:hypothetical protein